MATMRDVALHAGVSAKTVSRVLREDPYVSDKVRARVHTAVAELQYVPNTMAISFRSGRDAAIGVAVPDIADPFFAQIVQAIEVEARAHQTAVIVTSLGYDSTFEQAAVEALLQRQVQGLISCPVSSDQSYLAPWLQRTPIMFVDRAPRKVAADCVVEDDLGGAHMATTHLIDHGHHRVAFVGSADLAPTTLKRLQGYRSALQDAGLTVDEELIFTGATDAASLDDALGAFTTLDDPPTAIFSSNARTSVEVVPALQRLNACGMVLISFGDFPMAAALDPPVTVIDQDPTAVGTFAAQRLFQRIAHPTKRLRRRTVLSVSLIERDSCRRPVGGTREDAGAPAAREHQEPRGA